MPLLDLFWTMLWFYLFFAFIWLLVSLFADVFRSEDLGGFAKAMWTIVLIFLPVLGAFAYLIARGGSMRERAMSAAADQEAATKRYIQDAAGTPPAADEVAKLAALRDSGVLTAEEFDRQKAAALA
jgi:hypothetical protein